MIRVEVKNRISQELITRAQFNTQQEVDSWIEDCKKSECFGKNERWIREGEESISNAIESRIIEIYPAQEEILDEDMNIIQEAREAITRTEYKLAAEYTIEQLDITTQVNQENLLQEGRKRQELGAEVIAKVYSINEAKNISAETFAALIADSNIERIERMLWTGSLKTAKLMIQALDNTYFTNEEKQSILDMLSDY